MIYPRVVLVGFATIIAIKLLFYLFQLQKTNFKTVTLYLLLIGYIIIPFIIINYISIGKSGYNPKILISILILIWTNDTFAYLVGKQLGKHKLFPSVSPKKTIEGFVGGIVFTSLASILLSKYYIESNILYIWISIGLIVSIFSTLGDLIQSKFKRVAGIKDSGKIMPGHGGILDRLDSIIFVIPFINLFYLILYYVS
jgi:phosphatidate cytidylyltransferase